MKGVRDSLHGFNYPKSLIRHEPFPQQDSVKDAITSATLPKPYLQLSARLSQTWLNQWTVLLILILVHLLLVSRSIEHDTQQAVEGVMHGCTALELSATTAVSMPHYLAHSTNKVIGYSLTHTVRGVANLTNDLLVAVEELVVFLVNAFKATYICLLNLAITSSATAVIDAVQAITATINSTLAEIKNEVTTSVTDINKVLDQVTSVVTKAISLLGENVNIPRLQVPQIAGLGDITIPASFTTDLEALKKNINLDAVQNATDAVVRIPFAELRKVISTELSSYQFDESLFYVPPLEKVAFCMNSNLQSALDDTQRAVITAFKGLVAGLVVAALLSIIPFAYLEYRKWNSLKSGTTFAGRALKTVEKVDSIDVLIIGSQPFTSFVGAWLAKHFRSPKHKYLARWLVAYILHPPMTFLLLLALAGSISCIFQLILVRALRSAAPDIALSSGELSKIIYSKLANTSANWAAATNTQINATQATINNDLFGWVRTSTGAVNSTLTTFTDTLTGTLKSIFAGTILYDPILSVLDCILLLKIRGIEKGLTWVHDKAHVTLPQVSNDTLMLTQGDAQNLVAQQVSGTVGTQLNSAINDVADFWLSSIKQEGYIVGALWLVWVSVALAGLIRCVYTMFIHRPREFSGCLVKDVKQCISRPKPDEDPVAAIDSSTTRVVPPRSPPPTLALSEVRPERVRVGNFSIPRGPVSHTQHRSTHGQLMNPNDFRINRS